MNITSKVFLVLGAGLSLLLAVCLYSANVGQRGIESTIEELSQANTDALSYAVSSLLYSSIDPWRDFSRNFKVLRALERSNLYFTNRNDRQEFINESDRRWREARKKASTDTPDILFDRLLDESLSEILIAEIEHLDREAERKASNRGKLEPGLFSEVFLTNRYGANVAQTNLTSDYYQADELWWQMAKQRGMYVGGVDYDHSAKVDSIDVSLAINDQQGEFAGVIKVIINVQKFLASLDSLASELISGGTERLALVSRDKKIIYSSAEAASVTSELPAELTGLANRGGSEQRTLFRIDSETGREFYTVLIPLSKLQTLHGLDWVLLIDYDARRRFASIEAFRWNLFWVLGAALAIATLGGGVFASSLTRKIKELRLATQDLGSGQLQRRVSVEGYDELSLLGESFNLMAGELERIRNELVEAKERAEAAKEAKGMFLARMSHEIRTPLNAVIGMIESALDGKLSQEQRKELNLAQTAAQSLVRLLRDILDRTKIESGKLEVLESPFMMRENLSALLGIFRQQAEEKNISLIMEIESTIGERYLGDWDRLAQVLTNLVSNALKFTPAEGQIKISVFRPQAESRCGIGQQTLSARPESESEQLCFAVEDSGSGISEEQQEMIFRAFAQGGDARDKVQGTGLGLYIAQKLVELLGGNLEVFSVKGKGAKFQFDCPLKRANSLSLAVEKSDYSPHSQILPADLESLLSGTRILVAEDNKVNQLVVRKLLEKFGCSYVVAENGLQAISEFRLASFALVLMDLEMPELDGIEATKAIRRLEKQSQDKSQGTNNGNGEETEGKHFSRTPIIALTAFAMDTDRQRCFDAGMDDFLTKPIERGQFYRCVARQLRKGELLIEGQERRSANL